MKYVHRLSSVALASCLSLNSGVAMSKVIEQVPNSALSVQAEPVVIAQSGQNTFIKILTEISTQVGTQVASEVAREILRKWREPRPKATSVKSVVFTDGEWLIAISPNGNDLSYYGINVKTRDSLILRRATVSANSQRQVYAWNNGDYRYQVAWQPNDPQIIRLQVFNRSRELMNRLLYKYEAS